VEGALVERSHLARIRFVGAFDTVGSLGIPGAAGALFARRYAFHDTKLSGLVDRARHAIALDEQRASFTPTLWTGVPIRVPGPEQSTSVEQRWFVGSHANVGGGNLPSGDNRLATITREWMADEARSAGLAVTDEQAPEDAHRGPVHPSGSEGFFAVVGALVPSQRPRLRPVRQTNLGETLDGTVLRRWDEDARYSSPGRPPNPGLRPWVQSLTDAGART
jgi:hypothetical protein